MKIVTRTGRCTLLAAASLLGLMSAASQASAAIDITFNGDTTGQPTFNRPLEGLVSLSLVGTAVPHVAMPFQTGTGALSIETSLGTNLDTFLFLYSPSFNPASPLTNAVAGNDQNGLLNSSLISAFAVTAGTDYRTVVTGFGNSNFGTFGLRYTSAAINNFYLTGNLVGFNGPTTITAGTLHTGIGTLNGTLGSGNVTIGGVGTLNLYSTVNNTVANNIAGAGVLRKSGAGVTTITGGITHTGGTFVDSGTLLRNGTITGDATIANVAGATMAGNFNIAGTLTGLGANSTVSVGNSPGSATVGGLAGVTTQNVEVQFNNVGAPNNGVTHDFLAITGNVTGTHTINIIPFAPSGSPAATTGLGVELFRVGGTVTPTAFVLNGPVIQGGFEYLLRYQQDYAGTTDGFFLVSSARQELSLHAAMLSAGRDTVKSCARNNPGHPGMDGKKRRVWGGAQYGVFDAGAGTGVDYNGERYCAGGGADFGVNDWLQLGVSGGYAHTEADVNLAMGRAQMEGDTGLIEARAAATKGQFYVKGTLGYASTDWDLVKTPGRGVATATVDGMIGSLEGGYAFRFDEPVTLTVSAAALYDGTECGDGCLLAGAIEEVSEWTGKVSATLSGNPDDRAFQPFFTVALSDDLDGGQSSRLGNAVAVSDTGSAIFEAGIGLSAALSGDATLFAKAGMSQGLDSDYVAYQGSAGVRWTW